ncbi:AAA family ATPase [Gluconacetobacter entanii]|uniref:AAA family ATPase n=1 Tax=Gluconacetobacter entanii TaxID=108528 RepID=UPI0021BC1138|nr:AAA family ATPase [Gluconacetobacter entanii]MCW4581373.1 AAA family ATPase [Gluconacetobacter entanii]MCW4584787.1 AAA family ATPase [Gluconacetobacter entanii]MCW4588201.1 AAA family ATPase [Gluconacetobacter entanii]
MSPNEASDTVASSNVAFMLDVLVHLHSGLDRHERDATPLVEYVVQNRGPLGLSDQALPAPSRQDGEKPLTAHEWKRMGAELDRRRAETSTDACHIRAWLVPLQEILGLNDTETFILGIMFLYTTTPVFEQLWDTLTRNHGRSMSLCDDIPLFRLLSGAPEVAVAHALGPEGRLRTTGIIALDDDGDISILPRLAGLIARRTSPTHDVRSLLVARPRDATLPWDAFAHIGELGDIARQILRAAVAEREKGVHILLYGPPGTGKTEFAATLAATIGAKLYPVGEVNASGDEPSRMERLADLRCNLRLLDGTTSILMFDEAEDLFTTSLSMERKGRSRVYFHRLLEQAETPVIWIANDLPTLGPAVARRMALCIEMRAPDITARTRLWQDMATAERVSLSAEDATALAHAIPAAPGIFRNALRSTRLAGGNSDTASTIAMSIARATNGGLLPQAAQPLPADYDPALVNADCDLVQLSRQFAAPDCPRAISLLLSGPPGSGKSAWARHVAEIMNLPVLQKRASDLLGQYVGQTERQIAAAFAEARDTGAFLIFDEVDSLLGNRGNAERAWEVSQVNEMLTWMEQHPLPFACTTNLATRLDPASLRRFLFKARFDYLTPRQKEAAFMRFFRHAAPAGLRHVGPLTPSDFALVRRRARFMPRPVSPHRLLALLDEETHGREKGRIIGFCA